MEETKLQGLIDELGFATLTEKMKNDLVISLTEALQARVIARVLNMLTEKEKNELTKIIESGNEQEALDYMKENIPKLDEVIEDEFQSFREATLKLNKETIEAIKNSNQ